jgi:hypothetical protein
MTYRMHLVTSLLHFALSLAICAAVAYAWAGLGLWYFRSSQPETKERLRGFLDHRFFSATKRLPVATRRQAIAKLGDMIPGFSPMASLPLSGLIFSRNTPASLGEACVILVTINALLFFAGWMQGISWYGLRCFKLLGLEEPQTGSAPLNDNKSKAEKWKRAISPCLILLGVLCLLKGFDDTMTNAAGSRPHNGALSVAPHGTFVWMAIGGVTMIAGIIIGFVRHYSASMEQLKSDFS